MRSDIEERQRWRRRTDNDVGDETREEENSRRARALLLSIRHSSGVQPWN